MGGYFAHQFLRDAGIHFGPDVDDLVVAFVVGDKTTVEVGRNLIYLLAGLIEHLLFNFRDDQVINIKG